MSLLFVDGFNHYATADLTKKWSTTSAVITSTNGRRSGASLRTQGAGDYVVKNLSAATQTIILGFALSGTTLASSTGCMCRFLDSAVTHIAITLDGTGRIQVRRSSESGTILGTSSNTLSNNVFNYIELKIKIDDSVGTYEVRVNGVNWVSGTGADTRNAGNASVNSFSLGSVGSVSLSGANDFDDLYVADISGSTNNDFLGDVRVDTILPTSDGNYSQFTPSTGSTHFNLVDESTPNTSDYNLSSTVNDRDSYGMDNLTALSSQTVYGVQVNAAVLKDDAGARSVATMVRSSSTDGDGASIAIGTSQYYISQVYELNPNGSVAWTEATVNAMEAGVKVTA